MPLYEYRCAKCHRVFEVLQKFSDAPLEVHEGCGGSVERLISAPGLQFKGTGWYITDYKNASKSGVKDETKTGDPKPTEAKSDSKAEPAPAASETKTESKPAAEPAKQ